MGFLFELLISLEILQSPRKFLSMKQWIRVNFALAYGACPSSGCYENDIAVSTIDPLGCSGIEGAPNNGSWIEWSKVLSQGAGLAWQRFVLMANGNVAAPGGEAFSHAL